MSLIQTVQEVGMPAFISVLSFTVIIGIGCMALVRASMDE